MSAATELTELQPRDLSNMHTPPTSDAELVDYMAAELRVAHHNLKRRGSLVDASRIADAIKTCEEYRTRSSA